MILQFFVCLLLLPIVFMMLPFLLGLACKLWQLLFQGTFVAIVVGIPCLIILFYLIAALGSNHAPKPSNGELIEKAYHQSMNRLPEAQ